MRGMSKRDLVFWMLVASILMQIAFAALFFAGRLPKPAELSKAGGVVMMIAGVMAISGEKLDLKGSDLALRFVMSIAGAVSLVSIVYFGYLR